MSALAIQYGSSHQNYCMEKPTLFANQKLLIKQSEQGLQLAIMENDAVKSIESPLLNGLPKMAPIPQEFFEACSARVVDLRNGDKKVYFSFSLKGGGNKELDRAIKAFKSALENDYKEELSDNEIKQVLAIFREVAEAGLSGVSEEECQELLDIRCDCVSEAVYDAVEYVLSINDQGLYADKIDFHKGIRPKKKKT